MTPSVIYQVPVEVHQFIRSVSHSGHSVGLQLLTIVQFFLCAKFWHPLHYQWKWTTTGSDMIKVVFNFLSPALTMLGF